MFKIQRFDHMHVVPADFDRFNKKFEEFLGYPVLMNMPMEQYGANVAYEPAPIGVEAFQVTDPSKSLSAQIAGQSQGVFCVCYKVDSLENAIKDMETKGWKMLEYYDNAPILEALFDTKEDFGFYNELTEYPFESMHELSAT